jgi:hypothetical protein
MITANRIKRATYVLIATILLYPTASCNKQVLVDNVYLPAVPLSIVINPTQPGIRIPANFTGLSFETSVLAEGMVNADNKALIKMVKLLGTSGVLRAGGASVDDIFWTGRPRNGSEEVDSLYTDDVNNFLTFASTVGWPVIFDLNMAQSSASIAASEADYIYKTAGTSALEALEIGNAPDLYSSDHLKPSTWTYADFQTEWLSFYGDIHAKVPDAAFAAPSTSSDLNWLLPFISDQYTHLKLATHQYYYMNLSSSDASVDKMLTPDPTLITNFTEAVAACRAVGIPLRIDDCSNVTGGGKKSVSNTFASALWGLDYMYTVAGLGVTGVNFHDDSKNYDSPILVGNETATAEPLYYALLCFKQSCMSNLLPISTTNPDGLNLSSYAVLKDDGSLLLTLINKNSSIGGNITIHTGMTLHSSGYLLLTASALTSTSGVTFGGHSVGADGSFTMANYTSIPFHADSTQISIPAGSALLMQFK